MLIFEDSARGDSFHMENRDFAIDDSLAEEEPLTLPHFDDEATVQSARPVVPLEEVRRASRSKQKMLLGAALCLAAIVGAVTASFVFSNRQQSLEGSAATTNPESSQEASTGFIPPSGEASGATVDPDDTVAVDTAANTDRSSDGIEVQPSSPVSRPQPIRNSRLSKPVERVISTPEPDAEDRDAEERAARREERREERRAARRLRRERRAGDGLTRIREIFEGSPRP